MFSTKELHKMRSFIDDNTDNDNQGMMNLREKITDLITLRKAWNVGKSIEIERDCE